MMGARGKTTALLFFLVNPWSLEAIAQELRISDFRLPETVFSRLSASLNGSVVGEGGSLNEYDREYDSESDRATVVFNYFFHETSESKTTELRPSLSAAVEFFRESYRDSAFHRGNQSQQQYLTVDLPWQGSWYLQPEAWYGYTSALGTTRIRSSRYENTGVGSSSRIRTESSYGYDVTAGAGMGYGIVREGTGVYAVLRILDRLREEGLLIRDPGREEILSLAHLYSQRAKYESLFDRPDKYFWGDLFQKLGETGAIDTTGLTAFTVLKVTDVRLESITPRLFGWRVQAGVEHTSYQSAYNSSGYRSTRRGSTDYLMFLSEYGLDLSLSTHVYSRFEARRVATPRVPQLWNLLWVSSFTYELGERIETRVQYSFERSERAEAFPFQPPIFSRQISHGLTGVMMFYMENRVIFRMEAGYGLAKSDVFSREETRVSAFGQFGLTYRLF